MSSPSPKSARPIKAVLVTGGSAGGIGHATALEFAKLGYKVAVTGRNKRRLQETIWDLERVSVPFGVGRRNHFFAMRVDLEDKNQVERIIPQVIQEFGHLDILINCAGTIGNGRGLLDEGFFEDYLAIIQVNLMVPTRLAQLAAPYLLKAQQPGGGGASGGCGGVIINVGSVADRLAFTNAGFCISKAGLSMLTKTLSNSFEGSNVRVLTVSPGSIRESVTQGSASMGELSTLTERNGTSKQVADVIVFLASDKAAYMTGSTVDVDGGLCCMAGLLISRACAENSAENSAF